MSGELVERIARAIAGTRGHDWAALDGSYGGRVVRVQIMREVDALLPIINAEIAAGERDMKNRAIQCCAAANGQDNIDNGAAMTGAAGMARQLIERLTIRSQL